MKKIIKFTLCIIAMLLSVYLIYDHYKEKEIPISDNNILVDETKQDNVTPLIEEYKNEDIKAVLTIPSVIDTPVVQSSDNEYYLTHDLYKDEDKRGSIFLDYRNNLNDKKLLIYGHNSNYRTLTFTSLTNYEDEKFFLKHPKIYLYTKDEVMVYDIFTSYIEDNDYDYVNLNSFNGLSYYEHLLKLKNKSLYETNINVNKNSKIIILQTCTFNEQNPNSYMLVMGVLETENNIKESK